jgi:nicotinamidase-related amidase
MQRFPLVSSLVSIFMFQVVDAALAKATEHAGATVTQDAPKAAAEKLIIDPARTAILVMDYQTEIVSYFATDSDALLKRAAKVLEAARTAKIPVIYVVVGFRKGYPEISQKNGSFAKVKQMSRFASGSPGSEIHPIIAPHESDIIVTKHRVGAFSGSDLDMILRANGIDTLVMFGIATSGVVLSTLRYAADQDYRCVVVKDCCSDMDAEVHRVLTEKVFPRQAAVTTAEEFIAALRSGQ